MKNLLLGILMFFILVSQASAQISIPQRLAFLYETQFEYVSDDEQFGVREYYQSPSEFHGNRKGDCEDFAIHVNLFLTGLRYESEMYIIYFEDSAHAVTVFKDGEYYSVFSNGVLQITKETDAISAINFHYPDWVKITQFIPCKYGKINFWQNLLSTYRTIVKRAL
jgi:hypothetical protein